MKQKVSVIGIGRLGLSFALLLDSKGYDVVGFDVDGGYVSSLRDKSFVSKENGVNELLQSSTISFTNYCRNALNHSDIFFVFVPTPSKDNGEYDHSYIEQVVDEIILYEAKNKTLVICCTVLPGYCETLQKKLTDLKVNVVYNPSLIAQGSICNDLKTADIVLIGGESPVIIKDIYKNIMERTPVFKYLSLTGAEVAKIAINCFLSLKIAYANLLGSVCLQSGVSDEEMNRVLLAIGGDGRIGNKFLSYGYPASGICLPRDTRALNTYLDKIGVDKSLINGIHLANDYHMTYLKGRLINSADKNKPIRFYQLSYKPNVPIITESKHLELCVMLLKEGFRVEIMESEDVITQVKPILKEWANQINYIIK
jgi:nucleotide sugar dehydrogenase